MRFNFPHRYYLAGMTLMTALLVYGLAVLHEIDKEGRLQLWMVVVYGFMCFYMTRYYYRKYRFYSTRYVEIDTRRIQYCLEGFCITLESNDLDLIVLAKHRQMFKVHRVLHFFGKDGTYFYLTKDLNRFQKCILLTEYYFPDVWLETDTIIPGYQDVTADYLLQFVNTMDIFHMKQKNRPNQPPDAHYFTDHRKDH